MNSALIWGVSLAIGVAAVVLGAAVRQARAAHGTDRARLPRLRHHGRLEAPPPGGQQRRRGGALPARNCCLHGAGLGLGGVKPALTYVFVLSWIEWWQYVLGAGAIAALCLFFSSVLARDAAAGREDKTMLKLARYLIARSARRHDRRHDRPRPRRQDAAQPGEARLGRKHDLLLRSRLARRHQSQRPPGHAVAEVLSRIRRVTTMAGDQRRTECP